MNIHYNQIAGRSLERITSLVDGLFAIAMTIIVLEFRLPPHATVHSEKGLMEVLLGLSPLFLVYLMSFLTLGIFWIGQHVLISHMAKSDRHFTWLNLLFLALVAMLPFSTRLLAEFIEYRTALFVYWFNLFLLGAVVYWIWAYACMAKLVKPGKKNLQTYRAFQRRIIQATVLYAFGMTLCYFGTFYSIVFMVLVQLNNAIAPKFTARWTA